MLAKPDMAEIIINTSVAEQLIDITARVQSLISAAGLQTGVVHLWCHHTTAGLLCNENADPDVAADILMSLRQIVDEGWSYRHGEGNSPAHVKSVLTGCSLTVPVLDGRLALGRWQGIFLAEFDGPRQGRRVQVTFLPA